MSDRIRRATDFKPYLDYFQKWQPELKADRMLEAVDDMREAVVEHHDPVPGSSAEAREEAIRLAEDWVNSLRPGANINREMLMEASGLPKDNKSDDRYMYRWAKENTQLVWNPSATSHFIKQVETGQPH
jgi:hypothetical protein